MTRASWEPHGQRCSAHSKQTGQPCKSWAIRGSNVCGMHGGRAKQVQARARQRLDNLVDPALVKLGKLINDRSSAVAMQAVRDVLDRTGYKLPERIESDNATTIRVEYETIESPITTPIEHANGSYTNGTAHKD